MMTFKEWAKGRPGMTPNTMAYIVAEGAWDAATQVERKVCANLCFINGKDAPTQEERDMAAACAVSIQNRSAAKEPA